MGENLWVKITIRGHTHGPDTSGKATAAFIERSEGDVDGAANSSGGSRIVCSERAAVLSHLSPFPALLRRRLGLDAPIFAIAGKVASGK